jgi:exodeoxyribonuclease VII large subunit
MLTRAREQLGVGTTRLERSVERTLRRWAARIEALEGGLRSLSPLAVLERGYALAMNAEGAVIRSVGQVAEGDRVRTRLRDGEFISTVEKSTKKTKRKQ